MSVRTREMKNVAMAETKAVLTALETELPRAFPDQERVTKLVREAAEKAREIARLDGQDWPEVYFVELWAEFPFSLKVSEDHHELLSNAYEEVIVDA